MPNRFSAMTMYLPLSSAVMWLRVSVATPSACLISTRPPSSSSLPWNIRKRVGRHFRRRGQSAADRDAQPVWPIAEVRKPGRWGRRRKKTHTKKCNRFRNTFCYWGAVDAAEYYGRSVKKPLKHSLTDKLKRKLCILGNSRYPWGILKNGIFLWAWCHRPLYKKTRETYE